MRRADAGSGPRRDLHRIVVGGGGDRRAVRRHRLGATPEPIERLSQPEMRERVRAVRRRRPRGHDRSQLLDRPITTASKSLERATEAPATVYVVHCIDTEGPLYESLESKFERLRDVCAFRGRVRVALPPPPSVMSLEWTVALVPSSSSRGGR